MTMEKEIVEKRYCHFIISCTDIIDPPSQQDIINAFTKGTIAQKVDNLKTLVKLINSDENYPRLIMPVLTNLQQLTDHDIKKVLFLYWEIIEKTNYDGTIKEELILACNALRKDLLSPNEYIRGRTLRLVSKIMVKSILENLMEAIAQNLTHRHFYVRRNAIMCIYNIFLATGMELIEDFVDEVEKMCSTESDLSTKRNAFILLFHIDQPKALNFLKQLMAGSDDDPIFEMGDIFQLSILEMLRKLCKVEPHQKARLMNAIFMLSSSKSSSVLFECANTIVQLTTAPSAIKIAIQSYLNLIQDQNDNNVKLIILNRILGLKKKYSKLLEDYMSDILSIINQDTVQSIEINQKVLQLVTELANHRNIKEVGNVFENEIIKARKMQEAVKKETTDGEKDKEKEKGKASIGSITNEYRYLLIKCVNQITQLYPQTIPSMLGPLMDSFLMFEKKGSMASLETIIFIREVIEVYPEHRQSILQKLYGLIDNIKNHLVLRVAVWIIGEYSQSQDEVDKAFDAILKNIGSLPIFQIQDEEEQKQTIEPTSGPKTITKTIILPDGSYGTETIMVDDNTQAQAYQKEEDQYPLRKCLKSAEDHFLASCIALSLTKLTVKSKKNLQIKKFNKMSVQSSLIICALLKTNKKKSDPNNLARLQLCLKILTSPQLLKSVSGIQKVLSDQGKRIFQKFLESNSRLLKVNKEIEQEKNVVVQPDEGIMFRQLKGKASLTDFDITEEVSEALGEDAGNYEDFLGEIKKDMDSKVYQLTGFSDDIYAEAFMEVHHYDIVLKIVLMNRTTKTMSNINFELLTQGNLKIVEKPIPISLRAESSATIKASLKVSSTDNGIIYGNLTYETSTSTQPEILNINEIQIDFINDLMKSETTELEFKKKWAEYEWENKVQVNTTITDLKQYVKHFADELNISIMTKLDDSEDQQNNNFLVANFYTKSKFEEDCLLNMSIEKVKLSSSETKIHGLIRLRAKTEGMALCVGEKCKLLRILIQQQR